MREYRYKALNDAGSIVTGVRRADSAWMLDQELTALGLILLGSKQTPGSLRNAIPFGGRVEYTDLRDFTLHMSICLSAGIPLVTALYDFEKDSARGYLKKIIEGVRIEINGGAQLDEALTKYPEIFSETYIAIITAGQSVGDLGHAFSSLVGHLEWLDDLHGQTKQALVYPAMMVAGIIGLFTLMLFYVLPRFMDIFRFQNSQLPAVTQFVINSFEWLKVWWPLLLGGAVSIISGLLFLRRSPRGRFLIDRALLRMPVVGGFVHKICLSRFSRYFSLLFGAGTSLLNVLELLIKVIGNSVMAEDIKEIRDRVMTGESLSSSFARYDNFPPLIQRLVNVGEKTGQLDQSLLKAADYYDKEIPRELKQAFSVLNALIITVLGGLIAVAALAILLPIMQMRSML